MENEQDVGKEVIVPQAVVNVGGDAGSSGKPPRLHLWPLTLRLLLSLLLPVSVALLLDWTMGTMPWLTMATSLLCIPLASVIVGSAVLSDFARVIQQVAPEDPAGLVAPDATSNAPDVGPGA